MAGAGLLTVVQRVMDGRRLGIEVRAPPYVCDLPAARRTLPASSGSQSVFGPALQSVARALGRVLGGTASVRRRLERRRLERANLPLTVHDFRVEQVVSGLVAFSAAAAASVLLALQTPGRAVPLLVLRVIAFVVGALWRENRLSGQVKEREERILAEFPTVAELLALAVAAGEGPVSALDRVVTRTHGELSLELGAVRAEVRIGAPVSRALDDLAFRTGLPVVAWFAQAVAVALGEERRCLM